MATEPTTGKSWNDQTVPIPRDANGCTPPPQGQMANFGTQDDDAHRRPTLLTPDGRVEAGEPQ